ncbi:MAG: aggregation factor core [Pseudomonadota bacterium]
MSSDMLTLLLVSTALPVCGPAADIAYREGAPTDTITLINSGDPAWQITGAEILLGPSAGRLIFDTVPGGPGTQVSQPFRPGAGEAALADIPVIADGAESLTLQFAAFPAGARFAFTTDLDDRVSGAQAGTMISGAEIAGAQVTVSFAHPSGAEESHSGAFDAQAEARAAAPCLS